MAAKHITYSEEARGAILKGVNKLAMVAVASLSARPIRFSP